MAQDANSKRIQKALEAGTKVCLAVKQHYGSVLADPEEQNNEHAKEMLKDAETFLAFINNPTNKPSKKKKS